MSLLLAEIILPFTQELINFTDSNKRSSTWICFKNYTVHLNRERFVATIESIMPDGCEDVFDIQSPALNTFDANGLHAHNCGEQPLTALWFLPARLHQPDPFR